MPQPLEFPDKLEAGRLGQVYLPEAVLTETLDGKLRPALCYICPVMDPQPTASDYLDKIVMPARKIPPALSSQDLQQSMRKAASL